MKEKNNNNKIIIIIIIIITPFKSGNHLTIKCLDAY